MPSLILEESYLSFQQKLIWQQAKLSRQEHIHGPQVIFYSSLECSITGWRYQGPQKKKVSCSHVVIPSEMYFYLLWEKWPLGRMNPSRLWLNICRYGSVRLSFLGAFAFLVTTWAAYALCSYSLHEEVKCDGFLCMMGRNVVLWSLAPPLPWAQYLCPCLLAPSCRS